jgi:hypothetical protein
VCTQCQNPGYYLDAGICKGCTAISHCLTSPLSCTTATDSQCDTCNAGFYLDETHPDDRCPTCTPVDGCVGAVSCLSAVTSQCPTCAFGRYRVAGAVDTCPPCEAVPGCTSPVSCTNATDSQCNDCGPTTTTIVGGSTTTTTLPASLAHFNCYKSRDLRHPHFVEQRDLDIVDQFGATQVDVRKPYLLCAPASQDGSAVPDPSTHLCCYKTRAGRLDQAIRAQTDDVFGSQKVEVRRSTLVCTPCSKTVLP